MQQLPTISPWAIFTMADTTLADRLLGALRKGVPRGAEDDGDDASRHLSRDDLTNDETAHLSHLNQHLIQWNQEIERVLLEAAPLTKFDDGSDNEATEDRVQQATRQLASKLLECLHQFVAATHPSLLLLLPPPPLPVQPQDGQQQPNVARVTATSIRSAADRIVSMLESHNVLGGIGSSDNSSTFHLMCDGRSNPQKEKLRRMLALDALSLLLRSSKNWLRYLLVHSSPRPASTGRVDEETNDDDGIDADYSRDPRSVFQSMPMLTLYLFLMDGFCADLQTCDGREQDAARDENDDSTTQSDNTNEPRNRSGESLRCASLLLFYATFDPDDDGNALSSLSSASLSAPSPLQQNVVGLIQHHRVFERLLAYLLCVQSSALAVTLARNVHHFLVASRQFEPREPRGGGHGHGHEHALQAISVRLRRPDAERTLTSRTGAFTANEDEDDRSAVSGTEWRAPWADAAAEWDPSSLRASDSSVDFTYEAVLVEIVMWCLPNTESSTDGARNNTEVDDRRSELALEILRIFYAARLGQRLYTDSRSNSASASSIGQQRRVAMVLQLLQFQHSDDGPRPNPPWLEVQDSAIALLMDAHPQLAATVFEAPRAFASLLSALERHVAQTVSSTRIDNAGAAALAPVLAVLLKFCHAHAGCRNATKVCVFPNPLPATSSSFSTAMTTPCESKAPDPSSAKSMKPCDAPEGSLRANMIRMLTWPHSHIKRFAGELLWVLCDQDSTEFVRRVGMGNAIVVLGSKGVVDLPTQLFE
jgi:Guanine nucleotide exchange factor synembryn